MPSLEHGGQETRGKSLRDPWDHLCYLDYLAINDRLLIRVDNFLHSIINLLPNQECLRGMALWHDPILTPHFYSIIASFAQI